MQTLSDALTNRSEVRLLSSASIKTEREAEVRATSSLLAMIRAVSEFGRVVIRSAGGPAGRVACFTEVPCQLAAGPGQPPEDLRLDGVIQSARGQSIWTAIVEAKVGACVLDVEQIDKYHRLAKQENAGALITISNQPANPDGLPPVPLDGRRLRGLPVSHFSWERLLSEAQMLSRKKEVSDPDQKWMLDEWIRYVEDPASCIIVPPELGPHWNDLLRAARTGSMAAATAELENVAEHWTGFLHKASLRLRAKLGVDVQVRLSRKEKGDHRAYAQRLISDARANGTLCGEFRIPDAAGNLRIDLFLPSRSVQYSVEVEAPSDGRQKTRINWLAKQLRGMDLPQQLQVTADWNARGAFTHAGGREFVANPDLLLADRAGVPVDKDLHPRSFRIHWTTGIANCRGRSSAPVLEGISAELERFYRRIVENLVPYVPPAPKLVSQDGPDSEQASPTIQRRDLNAAAIEAGAATASAPAPASGCADPV